MVIEEMDFNKGKGLFEACMKVSAGLGWPPTPHGHE
jgi:hypothetical protein